METKKNLTDVLREFHPDGMFNEQQLWEAIAEADGHERDYYEDGDLAEWL